MNCFYRREYFLCSEQFLEVIKLENMGHSQEDAMMPRDIFLLQVRIFFVYEKSKKKITFLKDQLMVSFCSFTYHA